MDGPIAELTRIEEGEVVFAEIRSPYQRDQQSETSGHQTPARSFFYARDADPESEINYDRLWRLHHRWDDDRIGRRAFKDKVAVTEALAHSLPVSTYEQREAVEFVRLHDGRRFNQNGGILGMALGAFAAVRDEVISARFGQISDPLEQRLTFKQRFKEICRQHDIDPVQARKQAKRMRRE